MNRQEKSQLVTALKDQFSHSAGSILVGYKGLSVNQLAKIAQRRSPKWWKLSK